MKQYQELKERESILQVKLENFKPIVANIIRYFYEKEKSYTQEVSNSATGRRLEQLGELRGKPVLCAGGMHRGRAEVPEGGVLRREEAHFVRASPATTQPLILHIVGSVEYYLCMDFVLICTTI